MNKDKNEPIVTLDKSQVIRNYSHYVGVFIWLGWAIFYTLLFVAFPLWFYSGNLIFSTLAFIVLISAVSTVDPKLQPQWGYDVGEWTMRKTAEYCHIKVVIEDVDSIQKSHPAIFAFEPHDLLPVSMSCLNDSLNAIPGHKCVGCVSSACFVVPIFRHINTWVNACKADRKEIISLLEKGCSPVLCVGGVQEVLNIIKDKEVVLYLRNRLGFVRIAMMKGVPIIPIFAFGLNQCFDYQPTPKSGLFHRISQRIGFVPMVFYGVWGLPFGPCKPCDLVNVVGRPIEVPQMTDPTDEQIREYLDKYIVECVRLFETYKEQYGMGDFGVRVI